VQFPNRVLGRWHLCAEGLEEGVLQDASVPFLKIVLGVLLDLQGTENVLVKGYLTLLKVRIGW
jgi:hypothetical protein